MTLTVCVYSLVFAVFRLESQVDFFIRCLLYSMFDTYGNCSRVACFSFCKGTVYTYGRIDDNESLFDLSAPWSVCEW